MGQAVADALHRSDDSGKDLSIAPELSSRLDDIANAGNAHFLARRSRIELCLMNPPILQHEPYEILLVHFQCPGLVAMGVAQVDLADGKICDFKTHRVHQSYENVSAHVKRVEARTIHKGSLRILPFPTTVRCDRQPDRPLSTWRTLCRPC